MKIILIGPRTVNGHLDGIVWNYQLPLQSLGHEVFLLDILKGENDKRLKELVEETDPDLIFSILTTGFKYPNWEPVETIKKYTEDSDIVTFNWFADDVWRFDSFSSEMCFNFNCCSTTEPSYLEKYNEIGYENITVANWHANRDLYSFHRDEHHLKYDISFIGRPNRSRQLYIQHLLDNDIEVKAFYGLSFEQMIQVMSDSLISINFARNQNAADNATQMKGRMFEIVSTGSLLLTEYHEGIEDFFEENKEAVFFRNEKELVNKVKKLLDKPDLALTLSKSGFNRFLAEHSSQQRLKGLLEWIEKITT